MNRRVTIAILSAAALLLGEWAWASPTVWAQQGAGPAGQGMMTGPAAQGGAATGPGMVGQPGGTGPGGMMGWGYGYGIGPLGWLLVLLVGVLILVGVVFLVRRRSV